METNAPEPARLLVVDDDPDIRLALTRGLGRTYTVTSTGAPTEALAMIQEGEHDVALLDFSMPGMNGIELLRASKLVRPNLEVVMLTADSTVATAIEAMKAGAFDYMVKPFRSIQEVALVIEKAAERRRLLQRNRHLESMLDVKERFEDLVGQGPRMAEVFRMIDAVAESQATVLVLGESGTGKELIARAIHRRSPRRDQPFLAVNCSALTETLLESELFGHVKGAFTGATTNRSGLFEAAHHGTLFLDEIGDMAMSAQVKLLRTLQEGEVKRIGANDTKTVDVRVVAATNVDLPAAIRAGKFREDLFYRLNVVALPVPPLRDHPEDIPLLVEHFRRRSAERAHKAVTVVDEDAMQALLTHDWPGNVRELENAIERGVVLCRGGAIKRQDLPPGLGGAVPLADVQDASAAGLPYAEAKRLAHAGFERRYLGSLLRAAGGNISKASRAAQIDRSNLRRLLKEYVPELMVGDGGHDGEPWRRSARDAEPAARPLVGEHAL